MGVTWLEMTSLLNMNIISILCSKSSWNIHVMVELGKQFKEARNVLFLIHFFFSKVLSASLVTQITISITLGINMFYSTKINQFGSAKCLMHFHAPFTNLVCMTFSSPTVWQTPPPIILYMLLIHKKAKIHFQVLVAAKWTSILMHMKDIENKEQERGLTLAFNNQKTGKFFILKPFSVFLKSFVTLFLLSYHF